MQGQSRTTKRALTKGWHEDRRPRADEVESDDKIEQFSKMISSPKDRFEMRTKDMEGQQIFYVRMKE